MINIEVRIDEIEIVIQKEAIEATVWDCGSYHRTHYPSGVEIPREFVIPDSIFNLAAKMIKDL